MFVYPAVAVSNVRGRNTLSWRRNSNVGACIGAVLIWRGGEGLRLCCPGGQVRMQVSGVSCSVEYLHLGRCHWSGEEHSYVTCTCGGGG